MKVSKFGILVMVAAVALALEAFRPGIEPDRAEASIVAAYAVPSAIPGSIPAIAPASAPGNLAVVGIDCGGLCPVDMMTGTDDITFTLTRVSPSGDPAARFGANGGTTLVCDERTAAWVAGDTDCDVDTLFIDGNVAVAVEGGGQNEVVNVEACDQTGDCRNARIIFVETIFAVSPLHAAASFTPTFVSYACPVRGTVTVDPLNAPDPGDADNLADLENTVNVLIPSFVAGGVLPPTTSMVLPEDFGPKWRCGTAANSPQNRVSFETDAGMLSVESFVNGVTISGACDAGDSVDVIDYPGLPAVFPAVPAANQCDLDAFDSVVTYGLEGTGDVGQATLTAQQLGGGGPLRTINVYFAGAAALSLFVDAPATVDTSGGEFSVTVLDKNGAPIGGETVECTVAPTAGALIVTPQTGTTAAGTGTVTMTLVPTGVAVIGGEELTLTCALDSDPDVSASATINLSMTPELEAVDLVAGCNPVSSTWDDGTAASAVAAAVAPADALDAIWAFDTAAGTWAGYAPDAPAGVSDLDTVDRLDAIFICVDADATVSRPVI
ncbi:MAG: hypothetical protein WBF66_05505 [Dehalococcoidia bacterium]